MEHENYFLILFRGYKYLFLLLVIIFIIAVVFFIFALINTKTIPSSPTTTQIPNMTPPVANNNLSIYSFSPKNGTTNASIFEQITIIFSKPLAPSEVTSILFSAIPDIKGTQVWSENNTILTITPQQPLLPQQDYTLKIRYGNQFFTWSFTTKASTTLTEEEQIKAQTIADQNYGKAIRAQEEAYPWLQSLPLQTPTYFVFFDTNKKQMLATLYPTASSTLSIEQQEATIKSQILIRLQELGIDTIKYAPVWISKPK
jgi:hypothetical protein